MSPKQVANPTYKPIPHPATPYTTFESFYPFYLGEHSHPLNRLFHLFGTSVAILIYARVVLGLAPKAAYALLTRLTPHLSPAIRVQGLLKVEQVLRDVVVKYGLTKGQVGKWLLIGLLQGYACAWVGHFFVEKNRPATFKYPLYSLRGDFRLLWEVLSLQRRPL